MNDEALHLSAKQARVLGPRLESWAATQPDKVFVSCNEQAFTYGEAEQQTAELAAGLQALGIQKGDRVALLSASRIEATLSLLALARMGAIAVPLNTFLKGEFLRFQLQDSEASVLLVDGEGLSSLATVADDLINLRNVLVFDSEKTAPLPDAVVLHDFYASFRPAAGFVRPEIKESDPAAIIYTSGTTGMPKGCVCSQGYLMANSVCSIEEGWMKQDDVIFSTFPLFHSAGFAFVFLGALQAGATLVIEPTFSASKFMRNATKAGATVAFGVGAVGMALLATDAKEFDRAHKLRMCSFPPMPPAGQEAFEERFGTEVVCCGYGQTEMTPIATLPAIEARRHRAALGRPPSRIEVRVVDGDDKSVKTGEAGEIIVRPLGRELMFQGYWNRPDATVAVQRNLWHHTGDLGRFDEHGLLYFVDRKKDAMRRRGENVSSIELERAILQHTSIAAVATHAVPSSLGEDEIKACIILVENASLEPADLFEFFKTTLPYFAIPRFVEIMTSFPVNASGRVMKALLRENGVGQAWDLQALGFSVERSDRRAS